MNRHLVLLTLVATLGGLLFGYDTAVINGAVDSLKAFYIDPRYANLATGSCSAKSSLTRFASKPWKVAHSTVPISAFMHHGCGPFIAVSSR